MKKILKLILILTLTLCLMGNVYAALESNLEIETTDSELKIGDEFTVDINISNIQSELGIISLGATLEYDKESLEILNIEGKNGWETPTDGTSYNINNGKIAITRSGFAKTDETIFTITFKVKEESKQNLMIALKNITIADGTKPVKIDITYKNITIIDGTPNEIPEIEKEEKTNTNTITKQEENNKNTLNTTIAIICIILIILIISFVIIKNIKGKKKRRYMTKGKRMKK